MRREWNKIASTRFSSVEEPNHLVSPAWKKKFISRSALFIISAKYSRVWPLSSWPTRSNPATKFGYNSRSLFKIFMYFSATVRSPDRLGAYINFTPTKSGCSSLNLNRGQILINLSLQLYICCTSHN